MATPEPRYCPSCATPTPERYCPNDGVATFVRKLVAPSAAYLSAGDVVADKFRVQTLIGVGGFGAVYEAEHTGGLGHVAIKVLSPGDHNESEIRRFYREAQVTAGLRHANTVRVFDVGQLDSGVLYIAMERVHGHSLEDELRARQERGEVMTEAETLDIGIGTLKSLSEAHAKGLVHRDLKPANLMLTEVDGERQVKVLDFGIALVKGSSLTGSGQALGTPAYMSPEQCTGAPVDGRSDLYSLGIVLYRCLSGDVPFRDVNPLAVMMAQTTATPPPLVTLVKEPVCLELVDAINRAMEKAPERRFADAREMRAALEAAQRAAVSIGGVEAHDPHRGWAARYQEYKPDVVPGAEGVTSAGKPLAATQRRDRPPSDGMTAPEATRIALRRESGVVSGGAPRAPSAAAVAITDVSPPTGSQDVLDGEDGSAKTGMGWGIPAAIAAAVGGLAVWAALMPGVATPPAPATAPAPTPAPPAASPRNPDAAPVPGPAIAPAVPAPAPPVTFPVPATASAAPALDLPPPVQARSDPSPAGTPTSNGPHVQRADKATPRPHAPRSGGAKSRARGAPGEEDLSLPE